jgi:outer membrane protein assembly factor BamB
LTRPPLWRAEWSTTSSLDGTVYALDASTGQKLWSYTTGGFVPSSPTVANGEVYVGSGDGKLYAFDLAANLKNQTVAPPKPSRLKPNRSLRASN